MRPIPQFPAAPSPVPGQHAVGTRPGLPPARTLGPMEPIVAFLRRLSMSHWMLLLYPLFLLVIQRKRDVDDAAVVDDSAMMQIGFTVICGFIVVVRLSKTAPLLKQFLFRRPMIWLSLYGLLAIVSTAWSSRYDFTLYRSVEIFVFMCLMADAMVTLRSFEDRLKFLVMLCLSVVLFVHWSCLLRYGFSLYSLRSSEIPGALMGAAFAGFLIARKKWVWPYVAILLSTVLALSAASNISLLIGLMVGLLFGRGSKRALALALLALLLALFLSGVHLEEILAPGKSEGNLASASGRIPVWQWMLEEKVSQHPLLGFGFGQGEVQARLNNIAGLRMMHMHNAFMSAIANLGIVGASLLVLFYLEILYRVLKLKDRRVRAVLIGGTVAVMVNSMSIAAITAPLSTGWIGHAAFLYMIPLLYEQQLAAERVRRVVAPAVP